MRLIGEGTISAPGVDLRSVEISPCKLSTPDNGSPEEEAAFVKWQQEFAQNSFAVCNWREEFAEALLDEGGPLDDAIYNHLVVPDGKLPRDMTKDEVRQIGKMLVRRRSRRSTDYVI